MYFSLFPWLLSVSTKERELWFQFKRPKSRLDGHFHVEILSNAVRLIFLFLVFHLLYNIELPRR